MFDHNLVLSIVTQIDGALQKIADRAARFNSADEFTASSFGMEALDSICMLFMAVGEALKHIDKITEGRLFARYPEVDWKGAMGFRDVIAHHYFDVDAEQVFWICAHELKPLLAAVRKIREELQ